MRLQWALALVMCAARTAAACSVSPYFTDRSAGTVHFIGTASNDTVLAGAGSVKFKWEGTPRALFGQVVRVERLGATAYERPMASASDRPMDTKVGPDTRSLCSLLRDDIMISC